MTESILVLHVDDDPDFADMAAHLLEREDDRFSVTVATSASEALGRLADEAFDCIVSDYDMPRQNGVELLKTVREDNPDLPFILFTGKGSEEVASDAISAGVTDYLQKGRGMSQYAVLANRIDNVVTRYRAENERQWRNAIFEGCRDAIFISDSDARFVDVNEATVELTGYDREELLSMRIPDLHEDDDLDAYREYHERILSGEPATTMAEILRADGSKVPVEFSNRRLDVEGDTYMHTVARDLTERTERKRTLERDQNRMHAITDAIPDMVVVYDTDGRFRSVLSGPEDLPVDGLESLEGETLEDAFNSDAADCIQAAIDETVESGAVQTVEYALMSNGNRRWFEAHVASLDTGDTDRAVLVARDITERKAHGRELDEANTVLGTIVANLPAGVLVEDAKRDVLMTNEALCEILDLPGTTDDLIGRNCEKAAADLKDLFADPDGFVTGIKERIDQRVPVSNEVLDLADGRTLERDYVPYDLPDGEANLWLYRDVTDRVDRERELQQFERIVEHVGDAVWIHDPDGTLRFVNDPPAAALGLSPEDIVGKQAMAVLASVADPEKLATFTQEVQRILAGKTDTARLELPLYLETETRHLDVRVTAATINGTRHAVGLARNIDEQKRREQELQRQNKRLDEFASVVSHDLRNPLNVAHGRVSLALEEHDSEHLSVAQNALDRMGALIDDLLTLARQGRRINDPEQVALSAVATRCWSVIDGTEATLNVESDLTFMADTDRLQQLFENLFRNAIEHGAEDATICVGSLADRRGFYVVDDGPGIPEANRDEVFNFGYSTSEDGTGFGLAIVKEVVDAHGWNITLTDGADGGARFEITGVTITRQ
ncbi:PAS domain S-box protein [Halogeometricum borinquense]|uniref:histidine kinase n=1 Tax=Halogeometricum borinquense TaxID=60847 RepID=A0A482T6E3_9EURY|nr:PAS domain S-box protein [Halogeometricum borinquense]RYJ08185.1 PAS domain S-box protein [Halogeometricum borinquense]